MPKKIPFLSGPHLEAIGFGWRISGRAVWREVNMPILFAIIFLVLIFKCVGLVLGVCGKLLGAVLSLFGFIISIAIGAIVFGLSTAFALVLLCIAAVWLLIKLIL